MPRVLLVSAILSLGLNCAGALAQSAASLAAGVHFDDADISRAITMLEGGEPDGGTKLLDDVLKDPNSPNLKEREGELKAALGMLYARAGDKQKAQGLLRPLAERKEDTTLPARAKVLLAAATGSYKDGTKGSANQGPRSGWLDAIKLVRRDVELKLQQQDGRLTSAVNAQQFDRIPTLLDQSEDLADQVRVIEVDPESGKKMLATHDGVLKSASDHVQQDIQKAQRELEQLRSDLNDLGRRPKQKQKNQVERDRINTEIDRKEKAIESMRDAKRQIDEARGEGGADDKSGKRGGKRGGKKGRGGNAG